VDMRVVGNTVGEMMKVHEVTVDHTDERYLYINVDDQSYRIAWQKCSQKLSAATIDERTFIRVSPSGYGLHWPLIDEDLAVNPLLKIAEKVSTLPAMATKMLVRV